MISREPIILCGNRGAFRGFRLTANQPIAREEDDLQPRPKNDGGVEGEPPVFKVSDVRFQPLFDIGDIVNLATEAANLRQPGDARLNKGPQMIAFHLAREVRIVRDEMRARSADAHLSGDDVPKLRKLVEA